MELKNIKGIGDKTLKILKSEGIDDIQSLLYLVPKNYIQYHLTDFDMLNEMNLKCIVSEAPEIQRLKKVIKVSFKVAYEGLIINAVAFNMTFLKNTLKVGDEIVLVGKYDQDFKSIQVTKVFKEREYKEGIIPEYNIEGINNSNYQKIVLEALKFYEPKNSLIPEEYYLKYGYKTGIELFKSIHSPLSIAEANKAIEALKYYELLSFSIRMSIIRSNIEKEVKVPKKPDLEKVKEFIKSIPFELTQDQKNAVNTIFSDMKLNHPMSTLLEGDVGSGKTIIAIISIYAAITSGSQALVMAPTEVLSFQHFENFKSYFKDYNVRVECLTSSTKTKERETILKGLKNGDIDVIIGTHSLLNNEVVFKNLGFVVCDEQHKFGVEQRKIIREKGNNPDVLYMTATPIPRTLSLTLFNDMKLVSVKTMPKNRKSIITKIHTYKEYLKVLEFVESELKEGRQAYFVSPLIEDDSENSNVLKVKSDLESYFKNYKIGLLHGKMTSEEKEDVINKFMNHEIDILSSTTVIEVGINNPNASIMVILDASSFGLSSLHQLRGRVGRGSDTGYCFLLVSKSEQIDKLKILEETQDGFLISEEDLRLRGPGDFLGVNQSGKLNFRFADFVKDKKILENAINDAKELIKNYNVYTYYNSHLYSDKFD